MAGSPIVSFVIATHDGRDVLARCLASIARQSLTEFEVIVFDNGTRDHEVARAAVPHDPRFRVQRSEHNLGFAEANNRALAQARGEFVALVNDDAWLDSSWSEHMVAALRAHPSAGAAAGRTMQAAHPERLDAAGFAYFSCGTTDCFRNMPAGDAYHHAHHPFGPVASVAMYRGNALRAVGVFRAEYFCYYEDTDLALRLVLYDRPTVYVPEALAYHVGAHTGHERSAFQIYHLRRNVEYLYWVNMLGRLALWHLPWHVTFELLACGQAAIQGHTLAVMRAKLAAAKHAPWILQQRAALARDLSTRGELKAATRRLSTRMRHGIPWFRASRAQRGSRASRHTAARAALRWFGRRAIVRRFTPTSR